jgi:hypothetical protein
MSSEYKQHYKDRRALCDFCPSNPECVRIRTTTHCGNCPTALVCATESDLGRQDCDFVRGLWGALPRKCLLAASLLAQYPENHGVFVLGVKEGEPATEETASTEITAFVCPRCEEVHLTIDVGHSWMVLEGRTTTYVTTCGICDVHETFELTKPKH